MRAYERLLNYVIVRTPSDEHSTTSPSSQCQFDLARILADEMTALGISDVSLDEFCYVYGKIPATPGYENKPSIGFIAHMDTVSDYCDHDIIPVFLLLEASHIKRKIDGNSYLINRNLRWKYGIKQGILRVYFRAAI